MIGVSHRSGDRYALEITLKLPGQLPRTLHATLGGTPLGATRGLALTAEHGQAAMQIGARRICPGSVLAAALATAQYVALAKQCRQIAGQRGQAQGLAAQQ
ncbi:hypothetical protein D9M68_689000 [compost metagenome]